MTIRKHHPDVAGRHKFLTTPCPTCGSQQVIINGFWMSAQRKKAGLSQKQMAMRLLIAPSYLCDIEQNRRNCPPEIRKAYEEL